MRGGGAGGAECRGLRGVFGRCAGMVTAFCVYVCVCVCVRPWVWVGSWLVGWEEELEGAKGIFSTVVILRRGRR